MEIAQHQALFNSLYKEGTPDVHRDWSKKVYQLADYNTVKQLSESDRFSFLLHCLNEIADYYHQLPRFESVHQSVNHHLYSDGTLFNRKSFAAEVAQQLVRSKFSLGEHELLQILALYEVVIHDMVLQSNMNETHARNELLYTFPTAFLFRQLDSFVSQNGVSDRLRDQLLTSIFNKELIVYTYENKLSDTIRRFMNRLVSPPDQETGHIPAILDESDSFGQTINLSVQQMSPKERSRLSRLLDQSKKASGGKPSPKYLRDINQLIRELGGQLFTLSLSNNGLVVIRSWRFGKPHTRTVTVTTRTPTQVSPFSTPPMRSLPRGLSGR